MTIVTQFHASIKCYFLAFSQLRGGGPIPYSTSFVAVPFCHTYGMFSIINPTLGGVNVVFMRRYSSEGFLQAIQRYRVEVMALVPSLWVFLTKSPLVDKYDLSSVKLIFSGAAALATEVEEGIGKRFKDSGVGRLNETVSQHLL